MPTNTTVAPDQDRLAQAERRAAAAEVGAEAAQHVAKEWAGLATGVGRPWLKRNLVPVAAALKAVAAGQPPPPGAEGYFQRKEGRWVPTAEVIAGARIGAALPEFPSAPAVARSAQQLADHPVQPSAPGGLHELVGQVKQHAAATIGEGLTVHH